MDTISICVPTPLRKTKDPDLTYIVSALDEIRPRLHRGQLIVLESTTYPGTTEEVVKPKLEESGLVAGQDFCLAFSPERVDPGNPTYATRNIPKVVGGVDPHCTEMAALLYGQCVERVVPVSSSTSSRCSATTSASTCGKSSTRRPPSRSVSCPSTRAPAWAATASRSIRSTSRGRRARTASSRASSSWRR